MRTSSSNRRKAFPQARLQLEVLEDRSLPAVLDLTTVGATGIINDATYMQANPQPTGVGVINDFLRIQSHNNAIEQGFNTDARPVEFDAKSDRHTRSIRLDELPLIRRGGIDYRVILLGINQNQAHPQLSLDELRLFVSDSATKSGYNTTTKKLGGLTAVYDMGDNWVKLDSRLSHGNGSGDMFLFVPNNLLASAFTNTNPYVYLYSKFGVNIAANAGFEQWAPGEGVELPATSTVGGFVYFDVNRNRVRDDPDAGIAGVLLTLSGFDNQGQPVSMTATTAQDGSYSFADLPAGTYQIAETQPDGFIQGTNNVGTVDGVPNGSDLGGDVIGDIILLAGQTGINYNFGEMVRSG